MQVKIVNHSPFVLPAYATALSAGMDLRADLQEPVVLGSLERALVPTGLHIELPAGYEKVGPLYVPEAQLLDASGTTVYRGTGEFRQAVKGEGEGEATVTVTYQCCNNNTCLVPETKTFTVKL